jgi:N-acetylglucosamine kinase-like BadF-type ATPase
MENTPDARRAAHRHSQAGNPVHYESKGELDRMPCFLAIDVGGTKADYALVNEDRTLARVRSGSIKRMRVDAQTATDNLEAALRELTAQSGIDLRTVVRTCVGTAGQTVPLVTDWLHAEIPLRVGGDLLVLGDVEIALDAAFPGQPGILALAGTGSNVAGRTPRGDIFTAGGWGPVLSDQGSGHRIGVQALRALCLARDGGTSTDLLPAILGFWKLGSFYDLVAFANASPPPDFSQLVKVVVQCADRGDRVAQAVLEQQGGELADLVCLLIPRIQQSVDDSSFMPGLAFAGSIMEKVHRVRQSLIDAVHEHYPAVIAMAGVVDPLQGAIWHAKTGAGFERVE